MFRIQDRIFVFFCFVFAGFLSSDTDGVYFGLQGGGRALFGDLSLWAGSWRSEVVIGFGSRVSGKAVGS